MRGLSSFLAGIALLALAFWAFSRSGMSMAAATFAATALFFFARGSQGREVTEAGDFTAPMDFITNPAGAIVESAVDQFQEMLSEKKDEPPEPPPPEPKREPAPSPALEAALARHFEQRQPDAMATPAVPVPERRTFGRKGL